ncbi:MAG: hypothetical protein LV473_17260 [Nitrospira sp.]|nr:hypothetical protein [Nitrospira sp.]
MAARALALHDRQAKARKGNQPGATPANLPDLSIGDARDQVGKVFGVSGKSVDPVMRVLTQAIPEVVQAVEQGRMAPTLPSTLSYVSIANHIRHVTCVWPTGHTPRRRSMKSGDRVRTCYGTIETVLYVAPYGIVTVESARQNSWYHPAKLWPVRQRTGRALSTAE